MFLSLIDHFYNSMINGNKIKVSYSCIQNMKSIINNHNMKVLNYTAEIKEICNYRKKNNCPLDRKCLTPNIIYEAKVTSNLPNYKENFTLGPLKQISNKIWQQRKTFQLRTIWKRHWAIKQTLNNETQPFYTKRHLKNNKKMCTF